MLALLLISVAGFFALFFAMLTLLRHAAANGRTTTDRRSASALALTQYAEQQNLPFARREPARREPARREPARREPGDLSPALRTKRPDWRFLVRDGRRPFPSGQTIVPPRKPPTSSLDGSLRSDWAHYNKDLGDLNDPYQANPPNVRQA